MAPAAHARLARDACPYATNLTDAEWALVEPFLPPPARTGRPRKWLMRLIVDAILYALRAGAAWHLLLRDVPPWGTVYRWFAGLARTGTFERIAHALTMLDRERGWIGSGSDARRARRRSRSTRSPCVPAAWALRDSAATMRPRRWPAASGTPWSTRTVVC